MGLKQILRERCMQGFLRQCHQEHLAQEATALRDLAQAIKLQHPEVWQAFQQYVRKTYKAAFVAEFLPEIGNHLD